MSDPAAVAESVQEAVGSVLVGQEETIERLTIALLTRGHVLLEGVPGIAKTTMADLMASATGLDSNRIQMTPDVLPADITGTYIYRENLGEFDLQQGPVFTNIVVADEINRATPKTQSALLEAMQERRVSIEGDTYNLPEPFFVVATQNPIEYEGTFELPEAQRDRFQFKLTVDLPERADEAELLDRFDTDPEMDASRVDQALEPEDISAAREAVTDIHASRAVKDYILDLVAATREHPDVEHGASPRATIAFLKTGKAKAAIEGRDYVIPDDVKPLAEPILGHRLVLTTDADLSEVTAREVVADVVESVAPPGADVEETPEFDATPDSGAARSDGGGKTESADDSAAE